MGSSKESTTGGFLKQGSILAIASIMVRAAVLHFLYILAQTGLNASFSLNTMVFQYR